MNEEKKEKYGEAACQTSDICPKCGSKMEYHSVVAKRGDNIVHEGWLNCVNCGYERLVSPSFIHPVFEAMFKK